MQKKIDVFPLVLTALVNCCMRLFEATQCAVHEFCASKRLLPLLEVVGVEGHARPRAAPHGHGHRAAAAPTGAAFSAAG